MGSKWLPGFRAPSNIRISASVLTFLLVLMLRSTIPSSGVASDAKCAGPHGAGGPSLMPAHPDLIERLGPAGVAKLRGEPTPPEMFVRLRQEKADKGIDKISGTGTCLLILWEFSDHPADQVNHPNSAYDELIFSSGTHTTGSMNDFYLENSYGSYGIGGDVIGWTTASNSYASYENPDGSQDSWTARQMIIDAVAQLDPVVDFSQFDNDGPDGIPDSGDDDGMIDAFFFVHAGPGEEQSGDPNDIWSHAWVFWDPLWTNDGVAVYRYSVEPEEHVDGGLVTVGVFAHEYGHVLGLPDLYDTDYSSSGVGEWAVMAGGSWNHRAGDAPGSCPAHFTAWSKKELGWVSPTVVVSTAPGVIIPPAESAAAAYRIWRGGASGGDEYFLCENRRNIGFDEGLVRRQINLGLPMPEGMIIYHVDESRTSNSNDTHRLVDVVEASPWFNGPDDWYETLDGPRDVGTYHNLSQYNRADNGDLWPGFTAFNSDSTDWLGPRDRNRFDDDTIPPAEDFYCDATGIAIENITIIGNNVSADFVIGSVKGLNVASAKSTLIWDFETGTDTWQFCHSFAHHDVNHGGGCPGDGGLWFGVDDTTYACPPGYGNNWYDFSWQRIGVTSGASVTIRHKYDLEPGYDFGYLEVRCSGDPDAPWTLLDSYNGNSGCTTQNYTIPAGVITDCHVSSLGFSALDLRLRLQSDGGYSAQDGFYCGIGWWIDEITVQDAVSGVGDEMAGLGLPAELLPVSPNPFNPSTVIRFHVPSGAKRAELTVYDQRGRLVRSLWHGASQNGWIESVWDGRDESGLRVASGIYFARLDVDKKVKIQKMALVK